MNLKWGDAVMVLGLEVQGRRCDVMGIFRGIMTTGTQKGKAKVSASGVDNLYVAADRLWDAQDYFDRYHTKDPTYLPPNACGNLYFIQSEGTKGHLLPEILKGEDENGTKKD